MTNPRIMKTTQANVWADSSRILKKSLFSPAQPRRLLHPPALSLPGQPFARDAPLPMQRSRFIEILNVPHSGNELSWQLGDGRVRKGTPAALPDGPFEHPAG